MKKKMKKRKMKTFGELYSKKSKAPSQLWKKKR